ncbi:MAG: PAS domain S-box protein, partial [Candidatus Omnitrophica bacterium]|nr:PAS domain S-box protein [Candidatus Omnitrophota bacterium]
RKSTCLLEEKEERYRTLFESANDAIFTMDGDVFVDCNSRTLEMFGFKSKDQIIGKKPYELSPEKQSDGFCSKEKAQKIIKAAYLGNPQNFEWRHKRYDGTIFEADVNLNLIVISEKRYLMAVVRDATERLLAKQVLQKREEQYHKTIEYANDAIFLADMETGNIIDANTKAGELLGLPVNEIIGMHYTKLHPEAEEGMYIEIFQECIQKNKLISSKDTYVRSREDKIIPVEISSSLMELNGKKVLQGIFRDITDRKKVESALRNTEELYRSTLNGLLVGVVVYAKDASIIFANSEASRITGLTNDQIMRKSSIEPIWYFVNEDLTKIKEEDYPVNKVISTRRSIHNYIMGIKKPDSDVFVIVSVNAMPLFGENGELEKIVANFMDITERRKTLNALKYSEEKFRIMFETSPIGMAMCKMDGTLTEANQAYLNIINYTYEEVLKLTYWDITPKEYADQEAEQLRLLREVGKYGPYEKEYINKTGERVPILLNGMVITSTDGVQHIWSLVEDITERKKTESALMEAKKRAEDGSALKTEFLLNISHDIRTPMNVINGFCDLLSNTPLNKEQKKYCGTIKRKGNDLIGLIEDIVDVAALEKGRVRLVYKMFELSGLIEDVTDTAKMLIGNKNIDFIFEVMEKVPKHLCGDELRIKQILDNLCSNAIKYTIKGKILVTVDIINNKKDDEFNVVKFVVEDTGVGISKDKIPYVFEPYTRFNEFGKEKDGVGLGLHIVETLVKSMGGEVAVESIEGQGSKFTFSIKFQKGVECTKKTVSARIDQSEKEADISGMKILIAEDNADQRELIKLVLEMSGCEIHFACDGYEAIEQAKKNKYDVILMDLRMPVKSGIEATTIIRKTIDKKVPIIALTAHAGEWIKTDCLNSGMNGYVTKPIDIDDLKKKLQEYRP